MAELDDKKLLKNVIASLEKQLRITGIHEVSNGLEFCILRGESPSGPIAIKVPRDRVFSNVNDVHIDSKTLLDQEFSLMKNLGMQGITEIPKPMKDLEAAGFGALVMSYVPSDDSKPNEFMLGKLLAKIHSVIPPKLELSAQENSTIPELIDMRLHRRWKELTHFVQDLPALKNLGMIADALQPITKNRHLLHMDFREANLRTRDGSILAVVDWSNALLGHPALELARIAEIGETGKRFLDGYASITPLPTVQPLIETIFRLDTATMLSLVFLSEEPDSVRAANATARVRELYARLTLEFMV